LTPTLAHEFLHARWRSPRWSSLDAIAYSVFR